MNVSIIAALGSKGQLGWEGKIPWRVRGDLVRFRQMTWGHKVIVGSKTYRGLPPLPGRIKLVMSREAMVDLPKDVYRVSSCEEALQLGGDFVIGGGEIYKLFMPFATKMYLSRIPYEGPGDVFFPDINPLEWQMVHKEQIAAQGEDCAWRWEIWERI
jgi:dihydrofolate reductase